MHLTSSVNLDILFVALLHAAKSQNPHSTGNLLDLLYFSAHTWHSVWAGAGAADADADADADDAIMVVV
jgi:hypothetical protein